MAANGFRYIIVSFFLILGSYFLITRRQNARRLGAALGAGAVGYIALLIFAYTRNLQLTFRESIAYVASGNLSPAFAYVGGQNQTDLIAQDFYYTTTERLMGETYWDAVLRVAPNFVHSRLFVTTRPQDYIIETATFLPERFRASNWTAGSHLYLEALFNFGPAGPFLVLAVAIGVIATFEARSRRSVPSFVFYLVISSMVYSLAWYGFGNFLKQAAFAAAASFAIWRLVRQRAPGTLY